jgi:hypothetical protein
VRVGMEATGHSRWFERLLAELGMELRVGDAAVNTKNDRPPRGAAGRKHTHQFERIPSLYSRDTRP